VDFLVEHKRLTKIGVKLIRQFLSHGCTFVAHS